MYGFEGEVKAKYSAQMVDAFTEVYNLLPLAHCIGNDKKRLLVMHGGLFSKVSSIQLSKTFTKRTSNAIVVHSTMGFKSKLLHACM